MSTFIDRDENYQRYIIFDTLTSFILIRAIGTVQKICTSPISSTRFYTNGQVQYVFEKRDDPQCFRFLVIWAVFLRAATWYSMTRIPVLFAVSSNLQKVTAQKHCYISLSHFWGLKNFTLEQLQKIYWF